MSQCEPLAPIGHPPAPPPLAKGSDTMTQRIKNICVPVLCGLFIVVMLAGQLLKHDRILSDSERRALKQLPKPTLKTINDGTFMSEFEIFTQDQFLGRDVFRRIKAMCALDLFGQKEVNGLYVEKGYVAKVEYPMNPEMLDNAANRFRFIYDRFLADTNVKIYSCIIPDKNYFLAQQSGHLSMDYDELVSEFEEETPYMQPIHVFELLSIEDYYKSDTHWRQEAILPVAEKICDKMGTPVLSEKEYEQVEVTQSFYGVYAGQIAKPVPADRLVYLTNPVLEQCVVTSFDTGRPVGSYMYNMEKAHGRDPYEMFLSGSDALMTIENPCALTEKELVIFRDSFGSSLTPLLVAGYKKVTLVDIRYVQSGMIGNFVEFNDQDVLFMYSTTVLNNSTGFK